MWTRLIILICIATAITEFFGPWERFHVYYLVIGVAIPIFMIRLPSKKPTSSLPQAKPENVVHLDEYRRKKDQEKKSKEKKG